MRLRTLTGLLLAGYGLLVLLQVLAHESALAGWLSLGLGLLLFLLSPAPSARGASPPRAGGWKPWATAGTGCFLLAAVAGANLARPNGLGLPEWGLLATGALLAAAAPNLHRRAGRIPVATLVAWSFPVLVAPLLLFAANALLSGPAAGAAAAPAVAVAVVQPTGWALRLLGTPVTVLGSNLLLPTPRGSLTLGVGLVCAGLYPMVLFAGLAALQLWQERLPMRRLALAAAAGLAGLWLLNILRLVLLARIGVAWGPVRLQEAHANLGWVLFGLFMLTFGRLLLRPASGALSGPSAGTARPRR